MAILYSEKLRFNYQHCPAFKVDEQNTLIHVYAS